MQPIEPLVAIYVDTWVASFAAFGFMIPLAMAGLAGGYILGTFAVDRFAKTTLGTHVRHFFVRLSPSRFFPEDVSDERFILETFRRAVASGKLNIKDLV